MKKTRHPRLTRRGAIYYHRAAVPLDIRGTYPKSEETFSLKTSDYQEAVKLVRQAAALVDEAFQDHRNNINNIAHAKRPPLQYPKENSHRDPEPHTHAQQLSPPLLSEVITPWLAEKRRTSWVEKTTKEHRAWLKLFISHAGDRPINQYSKAHAKAFKDTLLKTPPNWSKHKKLEKLSLKDAAETAAHLGLAPMSVTNLNKVMGFVSAFWTWAIDHYDSVENNPFSGLRVKAKRKIRDERSPFTREELEAIFSAPIYTGCRTAHYWQQKGDLIPSDTGMYWVPLIGLHTGMRLGEIIQLYTQDVREIEGVVVFDVNSNGPDKRLKNTHSERFIPVHPGLIDKGFLEHVRMRHEENSQRLFPELKMGADGYYSSPFSKFFKRFLESVGVKHTKNAFHSFRHNFEDACRAAGVSKEIMDALQGHGEQGMSGRYGKGFNVRILGESIQRLNL